MSDTNDRPDHTITNLAPNYGAQGQFYGSVSFGSAPATRQRLHFTIEALPEAYVARPHELETLIAHLLDPAHTGPIAITAALRGAGGYGKTTLARAICHDLRVRHAFSDQIIWVTLGEQPGDLTARINDLIERLTHQRPGFSYLEHAADRLAELLDDQPPLLMVIDDVWDATHIKPLLRGGTRCTRLITTRNSATLRDTHATQVLVDAMRPGEAVDLLTAGLSAPRPVLFDALAKRLGNWPLLLSLVNSVLRKYLALGMPLQEALLEVWSALDEAGLTAFDARDARERTQAVAATIGISLRLLTHAEQARYTELVIFAEDQPIPLSVVISLWQATGGLSSTQARQLCLRLFELSLLQHYDLATQIVQLHDVVRSYLCGIVGEMIPALHGRLLDATMIDVQAPVMLEEAYLWRSLAMHLAQAKRDHHLRMLLTNGSYLQGKIARLGTATLLDDFRLLPDDTTLQAVAGAIRLGAHILDHEPRELANQLWGRLGDQVTLHTLPPIDKPYIQLRSHTLASPGGPLLSVLTGHTGAVTACAFSPDGASILSASNDHTLRLWDTRSGRPIHLLKGHTQAVTTCAFSPDGASILSASDDCTLRLWDTRSGRPIHLLKGHTQAITACAFSPDGASILSASEDRTLRLWDTKSGRLIRCFKGHKRAVTTCTFNSDGTSILSASEDRTLRLWDTQHGRPIRRFKGHTEKVIACAFNLDGSYALSASFDGTLRAWDIASGQPARLLEHGKARVTACSFSPDGTYALSASFDRALRLWNIPASQSRDLYLDQVDALHFLPGDIDWIRACTFSPNRNYALSALTDGKLQLWDIASCKTIRLLHGHTNRVRACTFSPDGAYILSASDDHTLRLWDVASDQPYRLFDNHTGSVAACAFSPDGKYALSASSDCTLGLWDVASGLAIRRLWGHGGPVWDCTFSPNGRYALSASEDSTLLLWDAKSGEFIERISGHMGPVNACAFSPDGRYFLSASHDCMLRLWDVASSRVIRWLQGRTAPVADFVFWLQGHIAPVADCVFSPDGRYILSASDDHSLRLWDTKSGQPIHLLAGHTGAVTSCAFSPDGTLALSASFDGTLGLWDVASGQPLHVLVGHTHWVIACAFSPDGTFALSASFDGTLRLWDVASGRPIHILAGHTGRVNACTMSPDGQFALSASQDHTLRFWDLTRGLEIACWHADAPLQRCAFHPMNQHVIAGDQQGAVHFLRLHLPAS